MSKKIIFILILIISLFSIPIIAEPQKILLIGDSHSSSQTGYGLELYTQFKNHGDNIRSYSLFGSDPGHWNNGDRHSLIYLKSHPLVFIDENNQRTESTEKNPTFDTFNTDFKPDIIIITLGTNIINQIATDNSDVIKNTKELSQKASQNSYCYWVGPPNIKDNRKDNLNSAIQKIKTIVEPNCEFIDSKPLSDETKLNSDNIHYTAEGGQQWAQNVFKALNIDAETNLIYESDITSEIPSPQATATIDGCLLTSDDSVLLVGASGVSASSYYLIISSKCPAEFDKAADPGKQISRITELLKEKIQERESSGKKMYTYAFIPLTSNDIASGKSADKLKTDLTQALDFAKSKNIQVITQTLTPFKDGSPYWKDSHLNTINELNAWIKELHPQKKISAYADFNPVLTDPTDPYKINPLYSSDGLHSDNPAGQKKVAEVFIQSFNMAKSSTPPPIPKASTSIGFTPGSAGGSAAKDIVTQPACDNPQRCQNLDEVWAKKISMYVNPESGQKIWTTTQGWRTFEEVYAPPPPPPSQLTPPSLASPPSASSVTIPTGNNCGRAQSGSTEMRALLDTIAKSEGKYNNMWCGKEFTDMSTHPYKTDAMPTPPKCVGISSTAAGRYGFLYKTYLSLKNKGQFQNGFTPKDQDDAAIALIRQKGITDAQLKTALESKDSAQLIPLFDKIAPVWASIPSSSHDGKSYYGQRAQSTEKITQYIFSCYDKLKNK